MTAGALAFLIEAAILGGGATPYEQAFDETQANGRPLLVLVGADWCPGCRTMKHGVLARMQDQGRLERVNFALVDADAHSSIAGRLMKGGMIPQLIAFSKGADGKWRREQITGATSQSAVESLIDRALADVDAAPGPSRSETALK
jgi:thioredoxin-like negative regulator of GroEL